MFSDVTHTTSRAPLSAAVFRAAWIGAALALAAVVVANAWVCDDAFITLRTIDNLVHGHGLRWNADERVQVFTHPLWLLVLAPFYAITREPYYTTLAVSIAASAGALWLTLRAAPPLTTAAVLLSLAACRTFVDFATSGLESPLLFVLLALLGSSPPPAAAAARAGRTLWLTSLAVLTRPDAALLFAPALVRDLGAARGAPGRWRALSGLAPLLAWELFSLLYYGSLLPNTAFAKLGTGASWSWSLA